MRSRKHGQEVFDDLKTDLSFVIDVHLARLCKYLRMMGLDCLWKSNYADSELLRVSMIEKRQLLTRDRALCRLANEEFSYYVRSIHPNEQLVEVVQKFQLGKWILKGDHFLTRCLECNTLIETIQPDQVSDSVPAGVKMRHHKFYSCSTCHRIYWEGTHFHRMKEWLDEIAMADAHDDPDDDGVG